MKSILIHIPLLCIGLISNAFAQEIKPLSVGSKVPNIKFNNVWNYKSKIASLSDFKKKLVILDFWNTSCSSCITAFPKLSRLQAMFEKDIQILLVNSYPSKWETEDRIKSTIEKYRKRTGDSLKIPIPLFDTILNSYFFHATFPHEVWIKDGTVMAITTDEYVTENNIREILKGNKVAFPEKNDNFPFDKNIPLLVNGNGGSEESFIYRSLFTKYNRYVPGIGGGSKDSLMQTFFLLNHPLMVMTEMAFRKEMEGATLRNIILDVKDSLAYQHTSDTAYLYCYNVTIPLANVKSFNWAKWLRVDLERVFNISVKKEVRIMETLVFTSSDKVLKSSSKNEKSSMDCDKMSIKKFIHNVSGSELMKILERYFDYPLINETNISQRIDIDFPDNFNLSDSKALIEFLEAIGFDVKKEKREIEVVIISDK